jgi:molybdate transport system substrate-binding protein
MNARRRLVVLLVAALACTLAVLPHAAHARPLTVFAAASLKEAFDEIAAAFAAQQRGERPVIAYAASSALARQIESGAPADVFVSADLDWMDVLDRAGLLLPGTRRNIAGHALVLVAPADRPVRLAPAPGFALVAAVHGGRLALADPVSVPAGRYARAALTALGVWPAVAPHVAPAENVRVALALVARGEAPLGVVYATDAHDDPRVMVAGTFPAATHPPIVYPAAAVTGAQPAARAFLAFLGTAQAQAILARHGFVAPSP